MTTHPFPPDAIDRFLTPVVPQHEAYIISQLEQSRTIYDILFSEQEEVPVPPESPSVFGVLQSDDLFAGAFTINHSFPLSLDQGGIVSAPDRQVTASDVLVNGNQRLIVPVFEAAQAFTLKLRLLINNANRNRVLLLGKDLSIPMGPFAGALVDLKNADELVNTTPANFSYNSSTGEVTAVTNGTYAVTLSAKVEV